MRTLLKIINLYQISVGICIGYIIGMTMALIICVHELAVNGLLN